MSNLETNKSELQKLYLSDTEVVWFSHAADAVDLSITAWVKSILRREAARYAPPPGQEPGATPIVAHSGPAPKNKGGRPKGSKGKSTAATSELTRPAERAPDSAASPEPTIMYADAVRHWQTRRPWSLPNGEQISDRGPRVTDFTGGVK